MHVSCVFEIRAHGTCGLVVEEFNSTKVVFDPFSEDGVFLSSVSKFTLHAPADIGIESEGEIEWEFREEFHEGFSSDSV